MTVAIEAGSDLDRAVADAIGFTFPFRAAGGRLGLYELIPEDAVKVSPLDERVPSSCIPHYSTDLNAAFAAAEKVGLWNDYGYCEAADQHVISKTVPVKSWGDTIAHEDTAALAICVAILKLKGEE